MAVSIEARLVIGEVCIVSSLSLSFSKENSDKIRLKSPSAGNPSVLCPLGIILAIVYHFLEIFVLAYVAENSKKEENVAILPDALR